MLEYKETMNAFKQDIDYLNASVNEINSHFGKEVVSIESTPGNEDDCVDIYEDGIETWSAYSFEETEMYLKGMKRALRLKGVNIE